ncbi:MAG: iron-sulfur cluster co-chaperone HscB C-terminal domain-containing protein [Planctomycetota bacterium]
MSRCPHCNAPLAIPLACAACGRLVAAERELSPFETFGIEPRFDVDASALQRTLLRGSRAMHPDFFGAESPEIRALAEENSARWNAAFDVLSDDVQRADWIVAFLGGPEPSAERQMPQAFLVEALDWSETLDDARRAPNSAAPTLTQLATLLQDRRRQTLASIRAHLVPLPAHGAPALRDVRRDLNAIRYFDRALSEIETLGLARPSVR